jgi:predicted DNA-binding transcriptional regulator YafY
MASPGARLLELLELLEGQPLVTGRELANRLGVDRRTIRRHVAAMQELGIPVEGERGVGGGYRLRPGFRLPPLMLADDEAVAVVLGLAAAERLGLAAADGALAKVERVLPDALRRRVDALERTLGFTAPAAGERVAGDVLLVIGDAIRRVVRIRARYRSFEGARSSRELSPYGLVVHSARWYLAAWDHTRDDLRTFRVDRMSRVALDERAAREPPQDFDAVAHVRTSLARVPWPWEVEVVLDLQLEQATARLPASLAELSDENGRTRLSIRVASLDWVAGLLAGLECDFEIVRPEELRASIESLARRLARIASAKTPKARRPPGLRPFRSVP